MERTFDKKRNNNSLFTREKSENSLREERSSRSEGSSNSQFGASKRRSYNPNFNADNHVYGSSKPSAEGDGAAKRKRPRIKKEATSAPERINPDEYRPEPSSRGFERKVRSFSDNTVNEFLSSNKEDRNSRPRREDFNKQSRFNTKRDRDFGQKREKSFEQKRNIRGIDKPRRGRKDEQPFSLEPNIEGEVRLNRFVAMSGVCSRRDADALIASGAITVNGAVVTELGTKVTSNDVVCNAGVELRGEKLVYIVMNKPKGIVTTVDDPNAEKTVIDLLQGKVKERVFPVGRLDKNSLGLILLTNDGELTKELTHPSFEKKKIYHVYLDKPVVTEDIEKLAEGIELEDGLIYADELSYVEDNPREVGIEIHSGRNRIVRRMFEHIGYKVIKLDRVYFAGITKKGLKRGFWRYLTAQEVVRLKNKAFN